MKKTKFLLPLALLFILLSCTKEGPQGPAGPQGPPGPQGATGPVGAANVQAYNFTATNLSWAYNATNWSIFISIPQITQSILNTGTVLVYYSQGLTTTLLPFSLSGIDFMYYASLGGIQVTVSKIGSYFLNSPSFASPVIIKVIIIQ